MPSQLDFSTNIGGTSGNNSTGTNVNSGFIPVRVKKVNITPSEDQKSLFQLAGEYWGVGAITFEALNKSKAISEFPDGSIALPINTSIRTLPLVNEIVFVIQGPSRNRVLGGDPQSNIFYYTNSIPVWNSTDVNALPSSVTSGDANTNSNTLQDVQSGIPNNPNNPKEGAQLGEVFKDRGDVKNLYPQEGDVIFEGRFGNSLRFGATGKFNEDFSQFDVNPQNPWSQNGNQGDPITILRNGQTKDALKFDVWQPIFEDINNDDSSIYLTSQQNIPLQIAYSTLTSYGIDVTPPEDTTAEFQKIGEQLGDQFTSNNNSDDVTSVRDSVNVEPDLSTDPNRVQPLFPGIGDNIIQPQSVGDVPSFEFDIATSADDLEEKENDPPLSFAERRRRFSRRGEEGTRRQSEVPTAAERKRNFRRRNQPTGSAATGSTETASQRKRRIRGGG